jgi:MFS family permease
MTRETTSTAEKGEKRLPRGVRALGWVSLLNDVSSEMIYPLLPRFLTSALGVGPAFLGVIEGLAETVAGALKIASGWAADRMPRRKPLVVAGYAFSSAIRPMLALAAAPWHALAVRVADRTGKGVRSAPRDALIATLAPAERRGRAFGFQRAMDHAGALIGPLLAALVLLFRQDLRLVFALAALPAFLCVIVLIAGVREHNPPERPPSPADASQDEGVRAIVGWRYLGVLALFTLGNSSDAFLLLRAQEMGVGVAAIPVLWSWHHLLKSATSTLGGALSDRLGRVRTIATGWSLYALTYVGFAIADRALHVWLLFAGYALFHALTEGPERALAADLTSKRRHGRFFGLYHAITGVMLLPASLLTGFLWQSYGAAAALVTGAALAMLASFGLIIFVPDRSPKGISG